MTGWRVCRGVGALRWLGPILLVVGCSSDSVSELPPAPKLKAHRAPAAAPVHHGKLDPGRPFELWLGRSNEIIYVPEIGEIEIDRGTQRGTAGFDERQWEDLRDLVRHIEIDQLRDHYVAEAPDEGTQWILRIRQGAYDRTIFCDNRFPQELLRFADGLDKLLLDADLADNAFEDAPPEAEQREAALWASIHR